VLSLLDRLAAANTPDEFTSSLLDAQPWLRKACRCRVAQQQLGKQPQRVQGAVQNAHKMLENFSPASPRMLLDAAAELLQCLVLLSLNQPPVADVILANGGWDVARAALDESAAAQDPLLPAHGCALLACLAAAPSTTPHQLVEALGYAAGAACPLMQDPHTPVVCVATWAMSRMAALALSLPGKHTLTQIQTQPADQQNHHHEQQQQQQQQASLNAWMEVVGPALCGDILHIVLDTLASFSLKDVCVTKHSLGYVEQVANAMAGPHGCMSALASASSSQVFAAAFVLAVNVAKTTDCLELQAASFSCLRAILPHVSPHMMGPKSLLSTVLRSTRRARAAKAVPPHHVFLVQVHGLCLASNLFAQEGVPGQCRGAASVLEPELHAALSHAVQFVAAQHDEQEQSAQHQELQPAQDGVKRLSAEGQGMMHGGLGEVWDELPCIQVCTSESGEKGVGGSSSHAEAQLGQLGRVHTQGLVCLPPDMLVSSLASATGTLLLWCTNDTSRAAPGNGSAGVNGAGPNGMPVLHLLAAAGLTDAVHAFARASGPTLLLGAQDTQGRTAQQVAQSAGHSQVVQLLEGFAVNGVPLPSRPCTPPTSHDDGTGSSISSASGFNSISSVAESEGRHRAAVMSDLDASAKHLKSLTGDLHSRQSSASQLQHSMTSGSGSALNAHGGGPHLPAAPAGPLAGTAVSSGGGAQHIHGGRGGLQQLLLMPQGSPSDSLLSKDDPVVEDPSHSRGTTHSPSVGYSRGNSGITGDFATFSRGNTSGGISTTGGDVGSLSRNNTGLSGTNVTGELSMSRGNTGGGYSTANGTRSTVAATGDFGFSRDNTGTSMNTGGGDYGGLSRGNTGLSNASSTASGFPRCEGGSLFDAGAIFGADANTRAVGSGTGEERPPSQASTHSHPSHQQQGGGGGGGSSMFSSLLDPFFAEHASDPLGGSVSAEAFKAALTGSSSSTAGGNREALQQQQQQQQEQRQKEQQQQQQQEHGTHQHYSPPQGPFTEHPLAHPLINRGAYHHNTHQSPPSQPSNSNLAEARADPSLPTKPRRLQRRYQRASTGAPQPPQALCQQQPPLQQANHHHLQQQKRQEQPQPQQQQQQQPVGTAGSESGVPAGQEELPPPDTFTQEAREHCERAGRCLGLWGSSLTVRPALRGVLLQLQPPELAGTRFQALQEVLGVRYQAVLRIITDHPRLLLLPEDQALARVAGIGAFWGHASPQETSLLLRTNPELLICPSPPEDCMCALARVLVPPLNFPELVGILTAHPGLLAQRRGATAGAANATAVLLALTEQMSLTKEEAVHGVVTAVPTLLLRSPGAVRSCCSALAKSFHLEPYALAGVVATAPSLLLRSPAELELMCARIRSLLGRSKHWQDGLEVLCAKPGALARTLSFDSSRLDRLQYLTSTLRDGGIKWHVALTMPEADWLDMYSGYKKWWAARAR